MSVLRNLRHSQIERRADWGSSAIPGPTQAIGIAAAGVVMNDDAALSISTVYRCVQLRAEAVATLPVHGFKRTDDRTKITASHPLIDNPSPDMTTVDFYSQMMFSILLRGNFYGQIVDRDPAGFPTAIVPIDPDLVFPNRVNGKRTYKVGGKPIPTNDMLHIPSSMTRTGGFIGLNPVEYMRLSWALARAAEMYGGALFQNSAHPSGAIQVDGDLSEEETLELARAWKQAHGGLGNAQYPAILTGGAKWQQISMTPEDAQFLATRQYQRHDIMSWFGIPPVMMGDADRSTAIAGIEQEQMMFVTNTLRADLVRIEAYMSKLLPGPVTIKFDVTARLRADTLQRYQAWQLARNGGWLNIDEIREKEDEPPLPDGLGQDHLQPLNMGIIGQPNPVTPQKPPNDAGVGQGGGNPANSPKATTPDSVKK